MLFSAQKQNKTGTWQTQGFVRFGPIKYRRGPRGAGARAPGPGDAAGGGPCASGCSPLAAPSSAGAPRPSGRAAGARAWPAHSHAPRPVIRAGTSVGAPAARPAPSRSPRGPPPVPPAGCPAKPLPEGPRRARASLRLRFAPGTG